MSEAVVFFADGLEEFEGLLAVDILRRAGVGIRTVSISDSLTVTSSHNVAVQCDALAADVDFTAVDIIILPGGIPGTYKLAESKIVRKTVLDFNESGKKIAAVCAAPYVLAEFGILDGRKAICHKKFRDKMGGAILVEEEVVVDSNITTAWGLGASITFSLELARQLMGEEAAEHVRAGIDYIH